MPNLYSQQDRVYSLMQRAENIVADMTPGGYLPPYRYNDFWKYVDDQPSLIGKVRRIDMPSHTLEVPRFGIQDQILHGANELTAMLPPQYVKFETGMIYLTSFKVMAEVQFTYEILEDNIKKGSLANYVLGEIRKKIPANLEMLILQGDRSISPAVNDLLCMEDGLIKRVFSQAPAGRPSLGLTGGHLVDATGNPISVPLWYDLERAVPEKYNAALDISTSLTVMWICAGVRAVPTVPRLSVTSSSSRTRRLTRSVGKSLPPRLCRWIPATTRISFCSIRRWLFLVHTGT